MEIKMTIKTRDGKAYAEGLFCDDSVVVKAGGKVSEVFRGYKGALWYRQDPQCVSQNGEILKDIYFDSASFAAQFVVGNITNGYKSWKVDGKSLGSYLDDNNIPRNSKKRGGN